MFIYYFDDLCFKAVMLPAHCRAVLVKKLELS
jgi:hypothetical protein